MLEKGIQIAIPFSRPHPRSKPQTVAENLHRNWKHRTGALHTLAIEILESLAYAEFSTACVYRSVVQKGRAHAGKRFEYPFEYREDSGESTKGCRELRARYLSEGAVVVSHWE